MSHLTSLNESAEYREELSDAVCTIIQHYSKAALKSLTGFDYFVQAVETARNVYV